MFVLFCFKWDVWTNRQMENIHLTMTFRVHLSPSFCLFIHTGKRRKKQSRAPLFSTISFSSPPSLSELTSSCLDVSLWHKCYRFLSFFFFLSLSPLSHTNSSPFVPVLFQRPLSLNSIWVVRGHSARQPPPQGPWGV